MGADMNARAQYDPRSLVLFNSPLECGVRATALLLAAFPAALDIRRLVQYDYLLVHSGDAEGPPSLHPATPHRSSELLVKRPLVEAGVRMMMRKSIITCSYSRAGIHYSAGEWAASFLGSITESYIAQLQERGAWVLRRFGPLSDDELSGFMQSRWQRWGSEFEFQTLFQPEDE